jgi:hypothetical protein
MGPLLFVLGSLAGGIALGLTLGVLTLLFHSAFLFTIVGFCLAAIFLVDRFDIVHIRPLSSGWQVPRTWMRRLGMPFFSTVFGVFLGFGVITITTSWGLYILIAWAAAQPTIGSVVTVFGVFGLARALPLLIIATGYYSRHLRTGSRINIVQYFDGFQLSRSKQIFNHIETAAVAFAAGTYVHVLLATFTL